MNRVLPCGGGRPRGTAGRTTYRSSGRLEMATVAPQVAHVRAQRGTWHPWPTNGPTSKKPAAAGAGRAKKGAGRRCYLVIRWCALRPRA